MNPFIWFLFVQIPYNLVGLFVIPLALAFTSRDAENRMAFGNAWNEKFYGVNGDPYWRESHPDFTSYWSRLLWLYRNSDEWLVDQFGVVTADIAGVTTIGDRNTANRPFGHSGRLNILVTMRDGTMYESTYIVKQWGNTGRCLRIYIGWKFKDVFSDDTPRPIIAPVFAINPLMGFQK